MAKVEAKSGVPYAGHVRGEMYPWSTMEIGQHFVYEGTIKGAYSATCYQRSKSDQKKIFKAHTIDGVVMVWRLK